MISLTIFDIRAGSILKMKHFQDYDVLTSSLWSHTVAWSVRWHRLSIDDFLYVLNRNQTGISLSFRDFWRQKL